MPRYIISSLHSLRASVVRPLQVDRDQYKRRHRTVRAIRVRQGDRDTPFSMAQERTVLKINYNDYYARQVGGTQYQRGHGLGSLFGGLLRSAMPLIKRGAVPLGKGALKTGVRRADGVMSGQSIKKRPNDASRMLVGV